MSTFEHCGECTKLHLTSQGSFAEDYSRFIGTWVKVSTYMDLPMYQCMDCGGLTQHLVQLKTFFISSALEFTEWISDLQIFYRPDLDYHPQVGRWAVTDCNPHHEHSCAGGKTQSRAILNLGSILANLNLKQFPFKDP